MTRKSRREIERAVDDMAERQGRGEDLLIVWEDPETGDRFDAPIADDDKEPVDPATIENADTVIAIRETIVETGYDQ